MDDLVRRAREFAISAHRRIDQRRKYTNQPYEVHLRAVAKLVESVSEDQEMVAAAWLHDVVEDTEATFEEIEREFGSGVAQLVASLTDVSRPKDGNRAQRKALDRAHLAGATPRAKTIKLADLIDNCIDIGKNDPRFARVFHHEAEQLLGVLGEGDASLAKRLGRLLEKSSSGKQSPEELIQDARETEELELKRWGGGARRNGRVIQLFATGFTSTDVAETLRSFDAVTPAQRVSQILERSETDIAGIRVDGLISGYVERDWLGEGACSDYVRPVAREQVVTESSTLPEVVEVLTRHDYCFVEVIGEVSAVVRRVDMQKPLVRTWLFGIISLLETTFAQRIHDRWPGGEWTEQLSKGRLAKARQLRDERKRRGQSCDLISCLQISDKADVLFSSAEERELLGFSSQGSAKRVVTDLSSLRNNLAHGQDIVSNDWPQIVRISRRLLQLSG